MDRVGVRGEIKAPLTERTALRKLDSRTKLKMMTRDETNGGTKCCTRGKLEMCSRCRKPTYMYVNLQPNTSLHRGIMITHTKGCTGDGDRQRHRINTTNDIRSYEHKKIGEGQETVHATSPRGHLQGPDFPQTIRACLR
jgi:hypothetical protein